MSVPKLRFKQDNDEEYPDWEEKSIIGLCEDIVGGGTPTTENKSFWNGNIAWISSSDLENNNIHRISITRFISEKAVNNSATKLISTNSVLIVSRVGVGKVAVAPCDLCTSQDFTNLVNPKCNSVFLGYLLSTTMQKKANGVQGTSIKGVTAREIKQYSLSVPQIEEQQKIADFLSNVDEVISQSEAEVRNLEQQKKGAMQKIFSQEVRFKHEDGTEFPQWEEKALSELFDISAGGDIDKKNSSKYYSATYPYAVYANALTDKGLYGYANYFKIGQDCFTVTGRGDVGFAVARHERFVPIVRLLVCIPKHNENVDCFAEIINNTDILVESTGVPQLTSIQLGKIQVCYPTNLEEQQKIADFLSVFDDAISYAKQELDKWKELKKGLLQQMFV